MFEIVIVALALATGIAAGQAMAAPACAPLPGADLLWAEDATRFVLFGEIHGTGETAGVVADAACLASRARPVIVALELDVGRQAAVDAFMKSSGDQVALARLGFGGEWTGLSDGRTSEAMLALLQRLRTLRQAGAAISVALIDVGPADFGPDRDAFMAERMALLADSQPAALIVGLTGNFHASRIERERDGKIYRSMAAILGRERSVSLDLEPVRGRGWFCANDGCGDHALSSDQAPSARGVRRIDTPEGAEIDFLYSAGMALTASPPVGIVPDRP